MAFMGVVLFGQTEKGFLYNLKKGLKERGGSETVQCGNLTVTLWQDTRPVLTIATDAQADLAVQVKRKRKDGSMVSVNQFQIIICTWEE